MNAIAKTETTALAVMSEQELTKVLQSSLYPGAAPESIKMVLGYCRAAGLDPIQKPVHIVPMWDAKSGGMRDVVMPGVNLYRTQAMRSGECAGVSEPEFGPDVTENIGGLQITFPNWCRVTVKRRLPTGEIVEFTAREFWKENYAVKGGKEKSIAPNAMWTKRPYGQIAKCAEAQALRKAFPEFASAPTADEMEGKNFGGEAHPHIEPTGPASASQDDPLVVNAYAAAKKGKAAFAQFFNSTPKDDRPKLRAYRAELDTIAAQADDSRTVDAPPPAATPAPAPAQAASKTFEQVMAMLCAATNEDALNVGADWIGTVTDGDQGLLNDKYDERLATLRGAH